MSASPAPLPAPAAPQTLAINETCPWSGKPVQPDSLTMWNGHVVGFCNPGCRDKFDAAQTHFQSALTQAGQSTP